MLTTSLVAYHSKLLKSSLVFFCCIKGQLQQALADFCSRYFMDLKGRRSDRWTRFQIFWTPLCWLSSNCLSTLWRWTTAVIVPALSLMTTWILKEGKNFGLQSRTSSSMHHWRNLTSPYVPFAHVFSCGPKQRSVHGDLILLLSTSPGLHHCEDRGCDLTKTLQCKHSSPVPTSGQDEVQRLNSFLNSIDPVGLLFTWWGKKFSISMQVSEICFDA